jgi:D-beta-D-heptose 7-phosphate kinase/D-beta-D-heptose 1-phosphate adenosyltransferase
VDANWAILEKFSRCRVLVVGDLMLDRYIRGTASRLSPEAPVPVLLHASQSDSLGGAANVARNIVTLGGKCDIAGFIGTDATGEALAELCEKAGIGSSAIVSRQLSPTTMKTRVLSGNQQLLRIDQEDASEPGQAELDELFKAIELRMNEVAFDAIVISDYAKGVTAPSFMRRLNALADDREIPRYVDPKGTDYEKYLGASIIKPNRSEMVEFARRWGWSVDDLVSAAKMLRVAAGLTHVALTLGDQGFALVSETNVRHISTKAKEVYDVTGAGDTVMATLVLALAAGLDAAAAADIANHAAAIAISKVGSIAVGAVELVQALNADTAGNLDRKVYTLPVLENLVARWRSEGKTVVFTNGCFDILHAGHTGLLQDARALGDRLIVGLNSDASITRLKGEERPLMPLEQRTAVVGALESVDAIVVYEEDTPLNLITALRPDILVKGGDYDSSTVVGAEFLETYGGRVAIVPITNKVSTSKLADALRRL